MSDLRDECRDAERNVEFWEEVKKEGRPISLISKPEAKENGGKSTMSESMAMEVSDVCSVMLDTTLTGYTVIVCKMRLKPD
jgi:hypothetical protein